MRIFEFPLRPGITGSLNFRVRFHPGAGDFMGGNLRAVLLSFTDGSGEENGVQTASALDENLGKMLASFLPHLTIHF